MHSVMHTTLSQERPCITVGGGTRQSPRLLFVGYESLDWPQRRRNFIPFEGESGLAWTMPDECLNSFQPVVGTPALTVAEPSREWRRSCT